MTNSAQAKQEEKTIFVSKDSLPACCPPKDQAHWNLHPRVYLALNKAGEADCPYCGNHFQLQAD